jgi:hypothetical protein
MRGLGMLRVLEEFLRNFIHIARFVAFPLVIGAVLTMGLGPFGQSWASTDLPLSSAAHVAYPRDAGVIDVKTQYGAKGDGVTDDTAALLAAIGDNFNGSQRTLYFPKGVYIVNATLNTLAKGGVWRAHLTFQGENAQTTVIRLKDHAPSFQNPAIPQAVIRTGSDNTWNTALGTGYNGFRNYIFDLTVSTGNGNPGAVGVDYLGNNLCGIENVVIRSDDDLKRGVAGLSVKRAFVGPCLFRNLRIDGFDYGISAALTEYSLTFEHIALNDQRVAGIVNQGDVLSFRGLSSSNKVPVILNQSTFGLVTVIDSSFVGPNNSTEAIKNAGGVFLRNIVVTGYADSITNAAGLRVYGNISEYSSGRPVTLFGGPATSLNLPVAEAPTFDASDLSKWVSVVSHGGDPTGRLDSTVAIQAALDTGSDVVYFPIGAYKVSGTLHVRSTVKKLIGLGSVIVPHGAFFQSNGSAKAPLLQIDPTAGTVIVDGVQFGYSFLKYANLLWVLNKSAAAVVFQHVDFQGQAAGTYAIDTTAPGPLFLNDVAGAGWSFDGGQHVWARQFDVEAPAGTNKIVNTHATLWIMGLKTEGAGTVITALPGTSVEVLGALLYPVQITDPATPAFSFSDAAASLTYAVSAYSSNKDYALQISERRGTQERDVTRDQIPRRGFGSLVTLYRTRL